MRPRCAPAHLLRNVRVFPRSSPSPVLRINLDLLPKSFSSYLLRPIYGLLPLRSQARTRTLNAVFNSASPCYRIATTKSGGVPNLSPLGYVVERHLFLSYPLRLRYLSIRGFTEPRVVRTGFEPVTSKMKLSRVYFIS